MKRLFLAIVVLSAAAGVAQTAPWTLSITGPAKTWKVSAEEWARLPKTTVSATNGHDKTTATYSGVLLRELLREVGAPSGENLRGTALAASVRARASDGYEVVLAPAELDPSFRDEQVLVADNKDGKPLSAHDGPLMLIVPGDKRPARWVRMLTSIELRPQAP